MPSIIFNLNKIYLTFINLLQADSGGPLTYKSRKQHVLIGATSWGLGCAIEGEYGKYSRISYYRDWIEGKMRSPTYCGSGPDVED